MTNDKESQLIWEAYTSDRNESYMPKFNQRDSFEDVVLDIIQSNIETADPRDRELAIANSLSQLIPLDVSAQEFWDDIMAIAKDFPDETSGIDMDEVMALATGSYAY